VISDFGFLKMPGLKAPFPYFGGKRLIAPEVWARFGDVPNYVEPFAGSCAVPLARPDEHRREDGRWPTETLNDINGWITNVWRAIAHDPDGVAHYADWPVSELDLHARGNWLFYRPGVEDWIERLRGNTEFYDVKSAAWWIWGQSCWIAGGWGREESKARRNADIGRKRPHLGDAGRGERTPHGAALRQYIRALSDRTRGWRVCCGDWKRILGRSVTTGHGTTAVFLDPPYGVPDRNQKCYGDYDSLSVAGDVLAWCKANGSNPLLRIALCGYDGEHKTLEPVGWECLKWRAPPGYGSLRKKDKNRNGHRERIWFSPACLKPE
jgi:DNA adenine methylase